MRIPLPTWLFPIGVVVLLAGCPSEPDDDDAADELVFDLGARLHDEIESLVYASWDLPQAATGHVEYSVDEGEWLRSPQADWAPGAQEQLLLGIPFAHEVMIRVVADAGEGQVTSGSITVTTGPVPAGYVLPQLVASDPSQHDPGGHYLLGSVNVDGGWQQGDFWKFIHDRQGRLVWVMLTPQQHWTLWASVARSGDHILWDELLQWPGHGEISRIHRMTLDGTVIETIDAPGAHHAFAEIDDGTLVWASFAGPEHGNGEAIVARSPDGTEETIFECEVYMASVGDKSWCAHNSLFWHESADTLLYSLYSHSAVLEVDRTSGDVIRSFGGVPGAYTFEPADAEFNWQHGVTTTDSGTLLLSTHRSVSDYETLVREYEVDDGEQALVQVWSFGEGEGLASFTNGDAHRLPGGNTLHNVGDGGRVREISPSGQVVWDLDWDGYYLLGRTILLDDLYDLVP